MSTLKHVKSLLVVLAATVVVPCATAVAYPPPVQPVPVPMPCPGEMGMHPGCCPGPCMCVPNVCTWGHFQKKWCPWPGDRLRADIRFPDARGIEPVPTPQGAPPQKLPREEYAAPQAETGPGVQIAPGAPTGPVEPPAPFDFGSGLEGLPGLDTAPQGPAPGPSPAEGVPEGTTPEGGTAPGTPKIETPGAQSPSSEAAPPAPLPPQNTMVPPAPESLTSEGSASPAASASSGPSSKIAVSTAAWEVPPESGEAPLPPQTAMEIKDQAPTNAGSTPPPAALQAEKPFPPAAEPAAETAPMPEITLGPERGPSTVVAESLAPLPSDVSAVTTPKKGEPVTAEATPEPPKPWVEPDRSWKSRRSAGQTVGTQAVDYEEPIAADSAALDGYCPVELVRHEQWVEGSRQWAVQHGGQVYLLAGPAQQRLFRANPERYVPVLDGCDPVLAATGSGRVAGRTDSCVIYEGRLYMFASHGSLAEFRAKPGRYVTRSDQPK